MQNTNANGVLDGIVAHKRLEIVERKQNKPIASLQTQARRIESQPLERAIRQSDKPYKAILEIKPASPSAGVLAEKLNLPGLLSVYQRYGVAFSVLTDQKYFGGSMELLNEVVQTVAQPVLCKDFIIDPYQVVEARAAGASAVLLIVKSLSDHELSTLNQAILDWGMTPLIEIQNEAELDRALKINPSILLINNRDLQTLEIDLATTEKLAPMVPEGILKISASGIQSHEDVQRLLPVCDGFLIGSALMKQPNPDLIEQKLQELFS